MAEGHTSHQTSLAAHLELFKKHISVAGLNALDFIAAVFRNNLTLCDVMGEEFIHNVCTLVDKHGKNARWLRFLRCLIFVNGRRHERNTILVMRRLGANAVVAERMLTLWATPEQGKKRLRLLVEREHLNADGSRRLGSQLQYHAASLDIVADCCKGTVPVAEVTTLTLTLSLSLTL